MPVRIYCNEYMCTYVCVNVCTDSASNQAMPRHTLCVMPPPVNIAECMHIHVSIIKHTDEKHCRQYARARGRLFALPRMYM